MPMEHVLTIVWFGANGTCFGNSMVWIDIGVDELRITLSMSTALMLMC